MNNVGKYDGDTACGVIYVTTHLFLMKIGHSCHPAKTSTGIVPLGANSVYFIPLLLLAVPWPGIACRSVHVPFLHHPHAQRPGGFCSEAHLVSSPVMRGVSMQGTFETRWICLCIAQKDALLDPEVFYNLG